jgi:hypothetical protein
MHFHVVFGSTFTSDPRSSIISPMLKSLMLALILNSLLVLLLVCRWLIVFSYGLCSISPLHFSRMFYNTLIDEGSPNILMHDCKKYLRVLTCSLGCIFLVWCSDGGMSYSGASLFFYVVSAMSSLWNSYRDFVNISFSFCVSNCFLGLGFFLTHWFCAGSCRTVSFPIFVPPSMTMLMFCLSSLASTEIH